MTHLTKIFIILWLLFSFFLLNTNAALINIWDIESIDSIKNVTIEKTWSWDIVKDIEDTWFSLLKNVKIILEWVLLIFIVYIWATMIMSFGSDDAKLTKSKTQIWYALIAIVFINVPWTIFNAIYKKEDGGKTIWADNNTFTETSNTNIFIELNMFGNWIFSNIISALQVLIFAIALYVAIMAGIKIMNSRWRDEKITEAKWKILYSLFALIFVWFMEAWKQFAIRWDIWLLSWKEGIFGKAVDISLLFAGPIAMIFLTLAAYYYITANWEEEKTKKAKSIIVNTLIAIVLLLVMVTFLNDILTILD